MASGSASEIGGALDLAKALWGFEDAVANGLRDRERALLWGLCTRSARRAWSGERRALKRTATASIREAGKKITVPPAWLKTLPELPISSLQIRSEVGYDKDPWLYVYFRSRSKPDVHVHVAFQAGKLAHAMIKTVDAAGKVNVETRKAP